MGVLANRMRRHADRLIATHGGPAAIIRMEGSEPQYPWDPPGEPAEVAYPVRYIETGYQAGYHDQTLIAAGDVLGIMAVPATITPKPLDVLRIGAVEYRVQDVKPMQPDSSGAVICFSFQARA